MKTLEARFEGPAEELGGLLFEGPSAASDIARNIAEIRSDYYEILGESLITVLWALLPGLLVALALYGALGRRGRAPIADAYY